MPEVAENRDELSRRLKAREQPYRTFGEECARTREGLQTAIDRVAQLGETDVRIKDLQEQLADRNRTLATVLKQDEELRKENGILEARVRKLERERE